jgi:hypothetical protein
VAFIASQVLFETAEYEMRFVKRGVYMRNKTSFITTAFVIILLFSICTGCGNYLREKQLENIAKDWCMVIRASQVIPVYPLTEDLQPGDLLLVSTPIEQQVEIYKDKGFLPLDQLIARLFANDFLQTSDPKYSSYFTNFYNRRYETAGGVIPPGEWQKTTSDGKHRWSVAPVAAFPSYQFDVQSGGGINLAIPIKGVPFALGIMNTDKASGSVTISEASTFGLDNWRLEKMVREWALTHRKLLRNYEPYKHQQYFLRVVSRVYVTGKLEVNISNQSATGLGGNIGADRSLAFMEVNKNTTAETYKDMIKELNKIANEGTPGARFTIASATSRNVSFSEDLPRPVVVGYVGFDMPIIQGGRLGPPISTLEQLTGKPASVPVRGRAGDYRWAAWSHIYAAFGEIEGPEANRIKSKLDSLGRLLPDQYPFTAYDDSSGEINKEKDEGDQIDDKNFLALIDYVSYADRTVKIMLFHPKRKTDPKIEENLQKAWSAYKEMEERLSTEPILMEAADFVLLGE